MSDVKFGSIVRAKYCYLADGSKLRVRDAGSNGFDYLGSLTYTSNSLGLQLESAAFGDGVIRVTGTSQEINYFLTDHLGSVRVIVDKNGTVKERNDYYAFGAKHIRGDYPQSDNRYDYNGKEEQTTGYLKFLDYGARMYDGALGRWFNVDPLAENHYYHSPYVYCANNPVLFIDPDGRDFWHTSDPQQIATFISSLRSGRSSFDFSSWNHMNNAQFLSGITYDDSKGVFWRTITDYKNGDAIINALKFNANFMPAPTSTGEGYPGAFVYSYGSGNGRLYQLAYNLSEFGDLSTVFTETTAPFNPSIYNDGINTWMVDVSGRITGVNNIIQSKVKSPGRNAVQLFIKGFKHVNKSAFHGSGLMKEQIFSAVGGKATFSRFVGNNPDIKVVNGKIVLQGVRNSPFRGKTYNTNLDANNFLK